MSVDPDEAQTDVTGRRSATQSDLRIAQNEHGIAGLPSQLFRLSCGEEIAENLNTVVGQSPPGVRVLREDDDETVAWGESDEPGLSVLEPEPPRVSKRLVRGQPAGCAKLKRMTLKQSGINFGAPFLVDGVTEIPCD